MQSWEFGDTSDHGARSVRVCDMIMWYEVYDYVISGTMIIGYFMIWL